MVLALTTSPKATPNCGTVAFFYLVQSPRLRSSSRVGCRHLVTYNIGIRLRLQLSGEGPTRSQAQFHLLKYAGILIYDVIYSNFFVMKYGRSANSAAKGSGSLRQKTDSTFVLLMD